MSHTRGPYPTGVPSRTRLPSEALPSARTADGLSSGRSFKRGLRRWRQDSVKHASALRQRSLHPRIFPNRPTLLLAQREPETSDATLPEPKSWETSLRPARVPATPTTDPSTDQTMSTPSRASSTSAKGPGRDTDPTPVAESTPKNEFTLCRVMPPASALVPGWVAPGRNLNGAPVDLCQNVGPSDRKNFKPLTN